MFIKSLEKRNRKLIDYAFQEDKEEIIYPNTYLLDLDTIVANGKMMIEEANLYNIDLFFMTKQLGRNPLICKKLMDIGYKGAVVVDFQEAVIMMENQIPIAHAGHLVQVPDQMIERLLTYGVGMVTIFSIEKAIKINEVAKKIGIIQSICLKFYEEDDFIYPGQNGGFPIAEIEEKLNELQQLKHIKVTTLTTFPCYLYDENIKEILPTKNLDTMKRASTIVEKILGYPMRLNMPSGNQTTLLKNIANSGGNSAEPGSALIGMTPNNIENKALEQPAMIYVTEISHNFKGHGYCFGGGSYPRGEMDVALVGEEYANAKRIEIVKPSAENIDYYIELEKEAKVGDKVLMLYRTQIFVTRSNVAVISGLDNNQPKIEGIYTSTGIKI